MIDPKFDIGDIVTLIPSRYIPDALGGFEVARLLPAEYGMHGYEVRSVADGHPRVVMESEIA